MPDLTPEKLAELRRLLDNGTPGPWRIDSLENGEHCLYIDEPSESLGGGGAIVAEWLTDHNANLIAEAINALPALLDAAAERDALAATVERVRALHRPVGIYDECECPDEAKSEGHEDVEEVGLTCNRMYTVCAECCRDDVYQTEDCANYHDHKPDEAHHCPTIRALDEEADA